MERPCNAMNGSEDNWGNNDGIMGASGSMKGGHTEARGVAESVGSQQHIEERFGEPIEWVD